MGTKRYEPAMQHEHYFNDYAGMDEDPHGEYVKWDDHEQAMLEWDCAMKDVRGMLLLRIAELEAQVKCQTT